MMSKYVESMRHNITPRQFFTYCKKQAEKKGISLEDWISFDDWTDSSINIPFSRNDHEDWTPPQREEYKAVLLDWHVYLEGAYTFIFEFTYDDNESTGCGYMYIYEK